MENKQLLEQARANAIEIISSDAEFKNFPKGKQFCRYKMIVRSEYEHLMERMEQEILGNEFEQDIKKVEAIWNDYTDKKTPVTKKYKSVAQ